MKRATLDDLKALVALAREQSFTKAAAKLGISQSTLSLIIRQLEERLGVRLVARTTRRVSLTEAGQRLVGTAAPRIEEIEAELDAIRELREKPAGTIRITATEYATDTILLPKLSKLLRDYPDIKVEIVIDYGLTDIVAQGLDAGVRSGEQVANGMIAVRIAPDMRMAVVGSPSYFKNRSVPKKPQDLVDHNCIAFAPADPRRLVRLGIRERWARSQGSCRRTTCLQYHRPNAARGAGWTGTGIRARGHGAALLFAGSSQACP